MKFNHLQMHVHQGNPLVHIFRTLSLDLAIIPLMPKATLTPCIKPYLGLPSTRLTHTSAINTHHSILSSYPNHLNTLLSTLFANSLSIPAHILTSSFLTYPFVSLPPNFSNTSSPGYSIFFSQHFSYRMPLYDTTLLVQLLIIHDYIHCFVFIQS